METKDIVEGNEQLLRDICRRFFIRGVAFSMDMGERLGDVPMSDLDLQFGKDYEQFKDRVNEK